jgi:alpha-beta hydrolase superfamily lysophospholipase
MGRMATVRGTTHTYVDSDGVTIHFTRWASPKPVAVAQISHGQGDHRGRYEQLAQYLVGRGFTVYADDHRGHGETGLRQWNGSVDKFGYLGPRGVNGAIDSISQMTRIARAENPGLPLAFLGHSMGSLLGQIALDSGTLNADLVVWSGTALRTLFTMNGGDLNARHAHLGTTGHEWMTRDVTVHHDKVDDPFIFTVDIMKQFGIRGALQLLGTPKPPTRDVPILMLQGEDDSLGNEKSVVALADRYVKVGYSDVTLISYRGARHEVYNETNRDEVFADLSVWLTGRLRPITA